MFFLFNGNTQKKKPAQFCKDSSLCTPTQTRMRGIQMHAGRVWIIPSSVLYSSS